MKAQRQLQLVVAGIVLLGAGVSAFAYLDVTVPEGSIKGVVIDRQLTRDGSSNCRISMSDGLVINGVCTADLTVGVRLAVDRYRRRLTGRLVHGHPRRD